MFTTETQASNARLYLRRRRPCRAGAALIETAISLLVFLTLVLGMLDVGIAVLRHHLLTHTAKALAREAIVHGELASELGSWGPAPYSGTAAGEGPIPQAAAASLVGLDLEEVSIQVQWIDGGNEPRHHRVRVVLSMPYQPIATFIFGNPSFTLRATCTLAIAH